MLYQHLPDIVGVVGAGQMGTGIAQVLAQRGLKVILSDRKFDIIERGLSVIQRSLEKQLRSGKITGDEATAAVGRIETAVSLEPFRKADFVIEAAPEDEEIKKAIFRKLDQVTQVHTILASNTSSISITRLAAVTSKPHRVVGMHFMHPVVTVPLVELAKGMHTSHATFESTVSLCQRLGKTVCVSQDRPGFILYRVLMPMINEAFFCMMEGVGTPEDIDRGMRLGTNAALGPLKLADAIGLDTCLSIMKVLQQQFGDSKYRPCPLLAQYVDGGWLGVKTGRGVFYYDPGAADKTVEKRVASAQPGDNINTSFAASALYHEISRGGVPQVLVDPAGELGGTVSVPCPSPASDSPSVPHELPHRAQNDANLPPAFPPAPASPPQIPDHPLGALYGPSHAGMEGPNTHLGVVHDAPGMSSSCASGRPADLNRAGYRV